MNRLERLEVGLEKKDAPEMKIGDTVRVHVRIKEGNKERIQVYEGIVIRKKGTRNRKTFTVRKTSFGIGVERIFPFHSPFIDKVETLREGKVRRAKLYYLRARTGRAARIAEKERARPAKKKAVVAAPASSTEPEA
ncbi:MAG: 50S ribosomal protein L19 [Nitrospirota bacterium]|nr:50S ribosomal protein L19 [Nitrospirota bacterium]